MATRQGVLRGGRSGPVGLWLGVPYAAPPVGFLRFRAPVPAIAWDGVRDATRFGASAPQPFSPAERVLGLDGHQPSSEDCLTLNIWSQGPGGPARPVMVWLHGGSFLTGAGSDALYDGHGLALRGDVVVVTLNYRLGVLGYLHLAGLGAGSEEADENLGVRDQIAALEWVRDNIAAFGGDPKAVTLFGQSAGAMAIGTLLGVPAARPLFGRAILQSGAAQHVHDRAGADKVARLVLRALGLRRARMSTLRDLPVGKLIAAGQSAAGAGSLLGLPFQPVIDGRLLPARPLGAIGQAATPGLPLLIGSNRDELMLYRLLAEQDRVPGYRKRLRLLGAIAGLAAAIGPRRLLRLRRVYGPGVEGVLDLAADAVFGRPAVALAETAARHAPVFMYRFDWPSPAHEGRLGACHALDVPFVWNTIGKDAARRMIGPEPPARLLATAMQEAWIAFAVNGTPRAAPLPDWPRYEPPRRATMILDTSCRLEWDPRGERRAAWSAAGPADGSRGGCPAPRAGGPPPAVPSARPAAADDSL